MATIIHIHTDGSDKPKKKKEKKEKKSLQESLTDYSSVGKRMMNA